MNRNFKLKFNRRTLSLDAVSELATSAVAQSTSSPQTSQTAKFLSSFLKPSLVALLSFTTLGMSFAQPARTGMDVMHGQVQTLVEGTVTTYTTKANSIINWQTFNIKEHEIVKFLQEHANSAVLNRVLGGNVSQILGQLQSNGKVFIVNPAGIVFGVKSQVDVAGLVASTLDLSDEDFLQGKYVFNQNKDATIASVLNQGVIKLNQDGTLALVGGQAINTGVLEAKNGTVYLLAGQSITIQDLENPLISYKVTAENQALNLGSIFSKNAVLLANKVAHGNQNFVDLVSETDSATQATINAQGEVLLYAGSTAEQVQTTADTQAQVQGRRNGLVVQAGTIQGHNTQNTSAQGQAQAAKVQVLGDAVVVTAEANIVAQEVNLGGDLQGQGQVKLAALTQVQAGATIDVSRSQGDAGTAIVWGDRNYVAGTFQAQALEGRGGFVETSGKELHLGDDFTINAQGTAGKGQWLLDPRNLHIVNATTYNTEKAKAGATTKEIVLATDSYEYTTEDTKAYEDSYLLDSQVENALKTSNVSLTSTNNLSVSYATINAGYASNSEVYGIDGKNGALSLTANNISVTNSSVHTRHINLKAHNNVAITASNLSTTTNLTIEANKTITVSGAANKLDGYTVVVLAKDDLSLTNVTTKAGQSQPTGVQNVTSFNLNAKGNISLTNVNVSVNFGQVRITSEGHKLEVANSTLQNNWQEVMLHALGKNGNDSKNTEVGGDLVVNGSTIDVLVNYYLKGGKVTINNSTLKNQRETDKANQSTISVIGDGPVRLEDAKLSTSSKLQFEDKSSKSEFIFVNTSLQAQGIESLGSGGLAKLNVTNSTFNSNTSLTFKVQGDVSLQGATLNTNNFDLTSTGGKISIGEATQGDNKVTSKLNAKVGNASIKAEAGEVSLGNAEVKLQGGSNPTLTIKGKTVTTNNSESKNVTLSGSNVVVSSTEGITLNHATVKANSALNLEATSGDVSLTNAKVDAHNVSVKADKGKAIVKDNTLNIAGCLTLNGITYEYQDNTGTNADQANINGATTQQTSSKNNTETSTVQAEDSENKESTTTTTSPQEEVKQESVKSEIDTKVEEASSAQKQEESQQETESATSGTAEATSQGQDAETQSQVTSESTESKEVTEKEAEAEAKPAETVSEATKVEAEEESTNNQPTSANDVGEQEQVGQSETSDPQISTQEEPTVNKEEVKTQEQEQGSTQGQASPSAEASETEVQTSTGVESEIEEQSKDSSPVTTQDSVETKVEEEKNKSSETSQDLDPITEEPKAESVSEVSAQDEAKEPVAEGKPSGDEESTLEKEEAVPSAPSQAETTQPNTSEVEQVQPMPAESSAIPKVPEAKQVVTIEGQEEAQAVNGIPVGIVKQGVADYQERDLSNWLVLNPEVRPLPTPPAEHQPLVIKGEDSAVSLGNETIFVFSSCKVTSGSGQATLSSLGVSAADMGLSLGELSAKYNLSAQTTSALEAECK
ncbi:filamentous hemagglutinin N-terminal domain-containing protein [Psittacicella gerlachiana]|uniref:Filamentous haemagglutinin FhaB/tRNA nuclease CdiA-like TPS domain-containing protein n=1 Tax=Psittacicella gerlachiana TaxID=2028574 RepID=A0A3A1YCD8_9GAMM|nr:filamentous hemagglutinin N-terminal domain-containing protein [Psittacicella gerlachiana]RIY34848.1 hypothetical protein CKF59_04625 [Psittacicella gerlachiana]